MKRHKRRPKFQDVPHVISCVLHKDVSILKWDISVDPPNAQQFNNVDPSRNIQQNNVSFWKREMSRVKPLAHKDGKQHSIPSYLAPPVRLHAELRVKRGVILKDKFRTCQRSVVCRFKALTPRTRLLLGKLTADKLTKKFFAFENNNMKYSANKCRSQLPIRTVHFPPDLSKMHFNIILHIMPCLSADIFPSCYDRNLGRISHISHACYMSRPFHPPLIGCSISSKAYIMNLLIT